MPANLPPEYFEVEKLYRQAKSIPEKIEALEKMLSIMPKHKGTDRLRAELRAKIAKLSEEAERKHLISRGGGYSVKKEGAGQAVLVGLPNCGKSSLLFSLTGANTKIADYPFTTQTPIPGMMKYKDVPIQLIDLPPINDYNAQSWLRGILRNADLLLIVVDLSYDAVEQLKNIMQELNKMRIKPCVKEEGEPGFVISKRALIVANKSDIEGAIFNYQRLLQENIDSFPIISVSAKRGDGLDELKEKVFMALDIIRVYTKAPGEEPDLNEPLILKKGSTVEDAAEEIHKEIKEKLKYAVIWGSGKFQGQKVGKKHQLQDGDIIEFHT